MHLSFLVNSNSEQDRRYLKSRNGLIPRQLGRKSNKDFNNYSWQICDVPAPIEGEMTGADRKFNASMS